MKKFEIVADMTKEVAGTMFFRIRALISFSDVSAGDLGGWIEKEDNLSQEDCAWIYDNARISGDALINGDAQWIAIGPVGSENGTLIAFRQKDNSIMVRRGCFSGLIDEFEWAVNESHSDNKHGDIYRALIPVIKMRLEDVNDGI